MSSLTSSLTTSPVTSPTTSLLISSLILSLLSLASFLTLSLSCFLLLFQLQEIFPVFHEIILDLLLLIVSVLSYRLIYLAGCKPIAWEIGQYILFKCGLVVAIIKKGSSRKHENCENRALGLITRTWFRPSGSIHQPIKPSRFEPQVICHGFRWNASTYTSANYTFVISFPTVFQNTSFVK